MCLRQASNEVCNNSCRSTMRWYIKEADTSLDDTQLRDFDCYIWSHLYIHTVNGAAVYQQYSCLAIKMSHHQHRAYDTSSPSFKLEPMFISVSTSATDGAVARALQCFLNMHAVSTLQLDSTQSTKTPAALDMSGISAESGTRSNKSNVFLSLGIQICLLFE